MTTQPDNYQTESVLARVVILLDQTALLKRGEQSRRSGLVESEATRELGYSCFSLRLSESDQERRSAVN
jgi:hypothetical protein